MATVKSSGLAIVYKGKLLLAHPTGHRKGSFTIPKGKIDKGETKKEAAIRETMEEVGITIPMELVGKQGTEIVYRRSKGGIRNAGKAHKIVYWYRVDIEDLSQLGIEGELVNKGQLQLKEVDWAGFVSPDNIEEKIFWRFIPIAKELGLI